MKLNTFEKLVAFGVVARSNVKNDLSSVRTLMRQGLVEKVFKKGRVFYALTYKALPILDHVRLQLLEEAKLRAKLYPRRRLLYQALLEDVRFLDTSKEEAERFRFLGDWRLNVSPTKSQLQLSQLK